MNISPNVSRRFRALKRTAVYWHPHVRDREKVARELRYFYATRSDYHAMTADPTKPHHPQVKLLSSLAKPTDTCVEFGCGGGVVLRHLAERTQQVIGIDIAPFPGRIQGDISQAPIKNGVADVAYSLEVLEHVWDPEAVVKEMVRVLKRGGLLFVTTPNGYTIDVYLQKRRAAWLLDYAGAMWVRCEYLNSGRMFRNMEPDLAADPVYPDCDMISKIFPLALKRFVESQGCKVERLETFFFLREKSTASNERERYSRFEHHWFMRAVGNHILLVARKC